MKENNELKREVKKLSNKLEKCYNSKVTFEHMLKNQRSYDDKCGLGFNKSITKGERKRKRSKLVKNYLISCATGAMKSDIFMIHAPT